MDGEDDQKRFKIARSSTSNQTQYVFASTELIHWQQLKVAFHLQQPSHFARIYLEVMTATNEAARVSESVHKQLREPHATIKQLIL